MQKKDSTTILLPEVLPHQSAPPNPEKSSWHHDNDRKHHTFIVKLSKIVDQNFELQEWT
jgi:hypothetical protein